MSVVHIMIIESVVHTMIIESVVLNNNQLNPRAPSAMENYT